MRAREFFVAARDAIQRLRSYEERLDAKRELSVMRARSNEPRGKGGVTDPSKRIDDLIEFEEDAERERKQDIELFIQANKVIDGLYAIDRMGAMVLSARYIRLTPWRTIANLYDIQYDEVRTIESVALDRIDSEGLAAMRDGVLRTTGAEQ